jgi:Ca2+/Na+ antiporter
VGLTGVIYAAIVVAWAIYLVPLALRRHEQTARNRSIERFSSSMRVLATGDRARSSGRVVATPPRPEQRVAVQASPAKDTASGAGASARPAHRAAQRAAAARRRRVLGVLAALTLLTAAVSVYGAIPRWSVALPILLIVVFLVVARRQVRRANETYWRQAADARIRSAAPTVVSRPGAARVDASHGVARKQSTDDATTSGGEAGTAGEQAGADHDDEEPTVTLTAEQVAAAAGLSEERVVAVALHTADGTSLWDPLPITLPTYVEKPVAKRSVRKITIGESGTWSAGHSAAASSVAAGSTAANATRQAVMRDQESADGDETDEEVESAEADERPRAANA